MALQPQWFMEVARDGETGRFRAWYNVKNPGGKPYLAYAYAESDEGILWRLPELGLVEVDGSAKNNLIDAPQGHFGLFLADDGSGCPDPLRRFKMAYFEQGKGSDHDDLPATAGAEVEGIGWSELLTSRDGQNWTRHREPFLDRDPQPGAWDHGMAWYAACITVDDREYIYYGGYSAGHKVGDREVGLALLRKDGFVSRGAGRAGGRLRTVPGVLPGDQLTVNAAVRGELRVCLLSADGRALPEFDWAASVPVRGDSLVHEIEWRGNPRLPRDRAVSLAFAMQSSDLYGFCFRDTLTGRKRSRG